MLKAVEVNESEMTANLSATVIKAIHCACMSVGKSPDKPMS